METGEQIAAQQVNRMGIGSKIGKIIGMAPGTKSTVYEDDISKDELIELVERSVDEVYIEDWRYIKVAYDHLEPEAAADRVEGLYGEGPFEATLFYSDRKETITYRVAEYISLDEIDEDDWYYNAFKDHARHGNEDRLRKTWTTGTIAEDAERKDLVRII